MSQPARILIVDDEEPIRSVLTDILESDGYEVLAATNGREALEALSTWRPDVILLDLMMPTITGRGFRAAQVQLDGDLAEIPVIVLSGARDARQGAIEMDAAAVITKPFDIDNVTETVERLVARQAQRSGTR